MAGLHQQHLGLAQPLFPRPVLPGDGGALGTIQSLLQVPNGEGNTVLQFLAVVHVLSSVIA